MTLRVEADLWQVCDVEDGFPVYFEASYTIKVLQ
jgi:hypothetical protein